MSSQSVHSCNCKKAFLFFFPEKHLVVEMVIGFSENLKLFHRKSFSSWFHCIANIMLCSFVSFYAVQMTVRRSHTYFKWPWNLFWAKKCRCSFPHQLSETKKNHWTWWPLKCLYQSQWWLIGVAHHMRWPGKMLSKRYISNLEVQPLEAMGLCRKAVWFAQSTAKGAESIAVSMNSEKGTYSNKSAMRAIEEGILHPAATAFKVLILILFHVITYARLFSDIGCDWIWHCMSHYITSGGNTR